MFSVATFNTHRGITTGLHPKSLSQILEDLDADIVALQEIVHVPGEPSVAKTAGEALGYTVHETALRYFGNTHIKPLGFAVLTRIASRDFATMSLGRAFGDGLERRGIKLTIGPEEAPIFVVATHLSHRIYGAVSQLRRIRRCLPMSDRCVLVGDLNCWGRPAALASGMRRAVTGRTWPARLPVAQIDHILVGTGIGVARGEVCGDVGSDHRPIRATLRVGST